jgi:hypothetical protein
MEGRLSSLNVVVNGIGGGDEVDRPGSESRTRGLDVVVDDEIAAAFASSGNMGLSRSRDSRMYIWAHR